MNTAFRPRNRRANTQCAPQTRYMRGPAFNLAETDQKYLIELAIPGWKKEQVTVEAKEGHLYISGKSEKTESEVKYHKVMFGKKDFTKSFILPDDVDVNAISAKFEDGVLYVSLSKDLEALKNRTRSIAIS